MPLKCHAITECGVFRCELRSILLSKATCLAQSSKYYAILLHTILFAIAILSGLKASHPQDFLLTLAQFTCGHRHFPHRHFRCLLSSASKFPLLSRHELCTQMADFSHDSTQSIVQHPDHYFHVRRYQEPGGSNGCSSELWMVVYVAYSDSIHWPFASP